MNKTISPIILAGGGGTRLWPLSRGYYPKQFLSLIDNESMLQKTLMRLEDISSEFETSNPIVITNEEQRFLVAEHARLINKPLQDIILEPVGRNTAPAITTAALRINNPESILLVMPSDHIILNLDLLHKQVLTAARYAVDNYLVTFGIHPDKPETGYGYIKTRSDLIENVYEIEKFVEKPSLELAEQYIKSGDYFWNSGLFVMKSSIWARCYRAA